MYVKMDNLDIYNDSAIILDKKTPRKIISWVTILIILFLLFIIFMFVPFSVYKTFIGNVSIIDDNSYLILDLDSGDFPIDKYKKLYIKSKKYDYEIIGIEDNKLILSINLDDNLKIDKNIITVNILKDKTTLFKLIKNKIKKGFDL